MGFEDETSAADDGQWTTDNQHLIENSHRAIEYPFFSVSARSGA